MITVDRYMRRRLGIREFSNDPDCILRVGLIRSRWKILLGDGSTIQPGEIIGMIHAWNERAPPIPPGGADLGWARQSRRRLIRSFQLLAQATREDPRLQSIRGFGGPVALHFSPAILCLLERLGIETYEMPPRTLREWIEEQVNRTWTWLMRRTFNPVSVQERGLDRLSRRFYWISREKLLQMYGKDREL